MSSGHHYIVCSTPRSGSFLFCETLRATGLLGRPLEYFSPRNEEKYYARLGAISYLDYVQRLVDEVTAFGSVFGAKVMYRDLKGFLEKLRGAMPPEKSPDGDLLECLFPGVKFLWLTRRNKIRQAVSYVRARQTQSWAWHDEPVAEPHYDFRLLDSALSELVLEDAGWQDFFSVNNISPFKIVHEDFVSHSEEVVRRVLEYLEISHDPPLEAPMAWTVRQSDSLSDEWTRRFRKEKAESPKA